MRKFLLFVGVFIIIFAIAILALNFIEPSDITITRSILIKAPKEAVFEQMVHFKNWNNWSPFYELDTQAAYTYTGTDGAEGSGFSWVSRKDDVGSGSMTNTAVAGTHFDYHLDFVKPYKSMATGYLQATDSAGMTKAAWSFSTHLSFPMNVLQVIPFMNMEKMLGSSFDHGLDKLKRYTESHPSETAVEVKEVDMPPRIYLGARKTIPMSDIMRFCAAAYDSVEDHAAAKVSGAAIGIYYTWDTTTHSTDMMAAYPVEDSSVPAKGLAYLYFGGSKACMAVLKGGYTREMQVHTALHSYAAAKGYLHPAVIEEYEAGPKNETDSNKWVTKIYYLLQ